MAFYCLPLRNFSSRTVFHTSRNSILNSSLKCNIHSNVKLLSLSKSLPRAYGKSTVRYAGTNSYISAIASSQVLENITQNSFVFFIQEKLIEFHDLSGLPWWSVIVLSTVAVRAILVFPLAVHQQFLAAKLEQISTEMDQKIRNEVSNEIVKLGETKNYSSLKMHLLYTKRLTDRQTELYIKHNGHPAKNLIMIGMQIPIWTSMSAAFRNLASMLPVQDSTAYITFLEMKASGFGIIKDLTVPDYTLTLAVIVCGANLMNIRLNRMATVLNYSKFRKMLFVLFQALCLAIVPLSFDLPKCITLYWATSSLTALLQNMLFLSPKVRRILRIPETEKRRPHMFKYIKNRLQGIIKFWKY